MTDKQAEERMAARRVIASGLVENKPKSELSSKAARNIFMDTYRKPLTATELAYYTSDWANRTTGKAADLSEESLRAALKHWNGMMVVDPATKNKKKKENKMVESRQYGCEVATIKKVRNGFIVYVSCETFVATKWADVAKALEDYYKDPVAAEKKYCKKEK